MELIEKVARAIASEVWHDEPDQIDQMAVDWIGPAKAAIRAMLDGVEPYAWHCVSKKYPDLDSLVMDAANSPSPEFNETPLYSLDALKEAVKP